MSSNKSSTSALKELTALLLPKRNTSVDNDAIKEIVTTFPELCFERQDFTPPDQRSKRTLWTVLHQAVLIRASIDVIRLIYECNPKAIQEQATGGPSKFKSMDPLMYKGWPRGLPLHFAIHRQNNHSTTTGAAAKAEECASLEVIQFLIQAYPEALETTSTYVGQTPLHYALEHRLPENVLMELVTLEVLQIRDKYGFLPLHYACWKITPMPVVQKLVDIYPEALKEPTNKGPLPNTCPYHCDDYGMCPGKLPLTLACRGSKVHIALVKYLLEKNKSAVEHKDAMGFLPIHYACCVAFGEDQRFEVVVRHLLDVWPEGLLHATSTEDGNDFGRWARGALPLHLCCQYKASSKLLHLMIKAFPRSAVTIQMEDDSNFMRYPIHFLCAPSKFSQRASLDSFKVIVESNPKSLASKDGRGSTPLRILCCDNGCSQEIVEFLLHKCDPSAMLVAQQSPDGKKYSSTTGPLFPAVFNNRQDIVQSLLSVHGREQASQRDERGNTVLHSLLGIIRRNGSSLLPMYRLLLQHHPGLGFVENLTGKTFVDQFWLYHEPRLSRTSDEYMDLWQKITLVVRSYVEQKVPPDDDDTLLMQSVLHAMALAPIPTKLYQLAVQRFKHQKSTTNDDGRYPLHIALAAGKEIDDDLIDLSILSKIDPKTGLYPFLIAATRGDDADLNLIYRLLRECPQVCKSACADAAVVLNEQPSTKRQKT